MVVPSTDVLSLVGANTYFRWNLDQALGTGVVVSYSFPTAMADYDIHSGTTFQAMTGARQDYIRAALDVWSQASGLTFVEVPDATNGEIRFSMFDMSASGNAGFSYFPSYTYTVAGDASTYSNRYQTIGGDVFLNSAYYGANAASLAPGVDGFSVLLHEIGHAIGFEHPFSGNIITPGHDNSTYTIMSYNRTYGQATLGTVDVEAAQYIYGADDGFTAVWDGANSAVVVTGTGGSDVMRGSNLADILKGLAGNDTLIGGLGGDTLNGGDGDDRLVVGSGATAMDGGTGNDVGVVTVAYDTNLLGNNLGHVTVRIGAVVHDFINVESIEFSDQTRLVRDLFGPGIVNMGNMFSQIIYGSQGSDTLDGNAGNDTLFGYFGWDTLTGGTGNDSLSGGDGNDRLFGGDGLDTLEGGYGNDLLLGELGNDTLNGGDGLDTLNGGAGDDVIIGGDTTADLRDVVYGGDGDDSIDGGYGNDELRGDAGNDTIAGGFGADLVIGGVGNDVITGSAYGDEVFGGDGDDFLNGGFGHDRVNGGAGADKFYHLGIVDHGSDWIQDYTVADGDVLVFGNTSATAADFQINLAHTANGAGVRSGDATVQEAFVVYRPTGQIMWALVDGEGQSAINIQIGGVVTDLLA